MIVTTRDLELLFRGKQSPHLLERFRRHDQIAGRRTRGFNRNVHLGKTVTIGGNHAHAIRPELPQYAVQDRPAFLRRYRKRRMGYQLLQVARANSPALVEAYGGKCWKLIPRQAEQLEA